MKKKKNKKTAEQKIIEDKIEYVANADPVELTGEILGLEGVAIALESQNEKLEEVNLIMKRRLESYFFNDGYLHFGTGVEFNKCPHNFEGKEDMLKEWEEGWKQARKDSKNENT